jgi:hypothetical protein
MSDTERKEKICEEVIERMNPKLNFLLQLVGFPQRKDLEALKARVEEIETLVAQQKTTFEMDQLVNAMKEVNNCGNSATFRPTLNQQTSEQPDESRSCSSRNNQRWSEDRSGYNKGTNSGYLDQNSGQQQESVSERNWSDRSYCNYCQQYSPPENAWLAQELDDIISALIEMRDNISDAQDSRQLD